MEDREVQDWINRLGENFPLQEVRDRFLEELGLKKTVSVSESDGGSAGNPADEDDGIEMF